MKVDTEGVITLAHLPGTNSPYSHSIDQVMRDWPINSATMQAESFSPHGA